MSVSVASNWDPRGEAPDVGRAVRILAAAADAGINWIDTAQDYYENRNEAVIGEALARCGGVVLRVD